MNEVLQNIGAFRSRQRAGRAQIFRSAFPLTADSRVLDIGAAGGDNIARVLEGSDVRPANVYIADIDPTSLERGRLRHGFEPIVISDSDSRLPFSNGFFDVVYCSSVIEHVTLPKSQIWNVRSGREFTRAAQARQDEFAREIRRLGRGYFVQTPNRWFPIESHSWLPFVGYLPRRALLPTLSATNRFWLKQTNPDWHLLTADELARLFPEARIVREVVAGLTKSIMAIKPWPPMGAVGPH